MPKNIVFCADGTWNGPGKDFDNHPVAANPTNVLKFFRWLEGNDTESSKDYAGEAERIELDPQNATPLQIAKYLDGVGYDSNWLLKYLGGVFGAGIITRIVRGYTFISRNYHPGDHIFLIGFSRGAYTVRALARLILQQGLLDASKLDLQDKEKAYRWGCAIWAEHRRSLHIGTLFTQLLETLYDLPGFLSTPPSADSRLVSIPIQTIGVWDTVGALGIPDYTENDKRIDAFRFADANLDARVASGFHAISLDEQRVDLTPSLWNPRQGVTQTLFPGAHADVGGGYPLSGQESALSDIALVWMQRQLENPELDACVRFGNPPDGIAPNALGVAHQPWVSGQFANVSVKTAQRSFPNGHGLRAHITVEERMKGGWVQADPTLAPSVYRPANIPD